VEAPAVTDELARFRLDGRVAVVSGGSGGIGSRLRAALGGVGARIVVLGRDRDRATAALEASGAVLLLCSDASAFITGQVLTLDGGLTACQ
jgi:NAD(P)-dependent dehydrogenase (short-subunit alcohol dehydrogenase family)